MTECKASAKSRQDYNTVVDPLSLFGSVCMIFSFAWDGQHHAGKGALQKFIVNFFGCGNVEFYLFWCGALKCNEKIWVHLRRNICCQISERLGSWCHMSNCDADMIMSSQLFSRYKPSSHFSLVGKVSSTNNVLPLFSIVSIIILRCSHFLLPKI